jgi:hypothetical protein
LIVLVSVTEGPPGGAKVTVGLTLVRPFRRSFFADLPVARTRRVSSPGPPAWTPRRPQLAGQGALSDLVNVALRQGEESPPAAAADRH